MGQRCMNCSCCDGWIPKYHGMVVMAGRLFEALLNRMYRRSEFDRLGPAQPEERRLLDEYRLLRQSDGEDVEFVGVRRG